MSAKRISPDKNDELRAVLKTEKRRADKLQKEADIWKGRCEARDRALQTEDYCRYCVNTGRNGDRNPCAKCVKINGVNWRFDEARFPKEA